MKTVTDTACPVNPRYQKYLERLGLYTREDVLLHIPIRYEDRTRITPIAQVCPKARVLVQGVVTHTQMQAGRRPCVLCTLQDNSGASLALRFFQGIRMHWARLKQKPCLRCFGEVSLFGTQLQMVHPEYQLINPSNPTPLAAHLTPIYPTTRGLTQRVLLQITAYALKHVPFDYVPLALCKQQALPDLKTALYWIHRPAPDASNQSNVALALARQRLAFEELVAYQLSAKKRRAASHKFCAPVVRFDLEIMRAFEKNLPFTLTEAQKRVLQEIQNDLSCARPMMRLLQGDVGSGKTVVAAMTALQVICAGYQVALMVPTELLAQQHAKNLIRWLTVFQKRTVVLSGANTTKERKKQLEAVQNGSVQCVVGTHALFQDKVQFARLGLIIMDEQQRFGVDQRFALQQKGCVGSTHPHQLMITATPIPRTLSMTLYADLDISIIDALPKGRKPIKTALIAYERRQAVISRIGHVCGAGKQAYWVCPLIAETEKLQCQAVTETAAFLAQQLPHVSIGLVHGRMRAPEKAAVMQGFQSGKIAVLVATTVIEVGVDVPNASLMIIESPERLGLSQLHQLRGRVGRKDQASYCVLLYRSPLSEIVKKRLLAFKQCSDGFDLSQKDLEMRGSGELFSTQQSGEKKFKIANLVQDKDLLSAAKKACDMIWTQYPDHVDPLIKRWIGQGEQYVNV